MVSWVLFHSGVCYGDIRKANALDSECSMVTAPLFLPLRPSSCTKMWECAQQLHPSYKTHQAEQEPCAKQLSALHPSTEHTLRITDAKGFPSGIFNVFPLSNKSYNIRSPDVSSMSFLGALQKTYGSGIPSFVSCQPEYMDHFFLRRVCVSFLQTLSCDYDLAEYEGKSICWLQGSMVRNMMVGISLESCPDGILLIQISHRLCASNSSPQSMPQNTRGGFMMGGFLIYRWSSLDMKSIKRWSCRDMGKVGGKS